MAKRRNVRQQSHARPRNAAVPTDQLVNWAGRRYGDELAGVTVDEQSALGLSAFYRAVSLISGTLASLPLRSYREGSDKRPERVPSVFDEPDGIDGQTLYEWKETAFLHLLLHGGAGALKVRNEGGGLARLPLVHPLSFRVADPKDDESPVGGLWFHVQTSDGKSVKLDATDFWYVPGMSLDGKTGVSLLTYARMSLGTTVAADRAAARTFSRGAMIGGIASIDDDDGLDDGDYAKAKAEINRSVLGHENAGTIPLLNRRIKFQPWQMSMADAQFLQSRQFQVEEVARWTGVPPHLLMQTEKQTSWGTGVDEQNRGLSKFVLGHWAQRFEQRASRLLARPRWAEFDFAGLERPNFVTEIDTLIKQVQAGILTVDEARALRNLPPLPKAAEPAPTPPADDDEEGDDDA